MSIQTKSAHTVNRQPSLILHFENPLIGGPCLYSRHAHPFCCVHACWLEPVPLESARPSTPNKVCNVPHPVSGPLYNSCRHNAPTKLQRKSKAEISRKRKVKTKTMKVPDTSPAGRAWSLFLGRKVQPPNVGNPV
ncbi:hypothetical protein VFPBJ_01067 [Purpureocillium lilacinum]|uniref:Uncharacterized protein n=1 Tax=Purpureocillium lilacinum TaxID=33203 RepID=A0A179HA60_PURLI|nr:hypothetical protein VFPBJ_01067 [Purpureocillium lilacinum]